MKYKIEELSNGNIKTIYSLSKEGDIIEWSIISENPLGNGTYIIVNKNNSSMVSNVHWKDLEYYIGYSNIWGLTIDDIKERYEIFSNKVKSKLNEYVQS